MINAFNLTINNIEPALGLQRSGSLTDRDHPDRRKEYQQKWRSPPLQRQQQDLEVTALHEPAPCLAQVLLLPEQNLCYRWRLRYELRSL